MSEKSYGDIQVLCHPELMPADVGAQADELYKICSIMGSPKPETWPEGLALAAAMGFHFPQCQPIPLAKMVRIFHPQMSLVPGAQWPSMQLACCMRLTCVVARPAMQLLRPSDP